MPRTSSANPSGASSRFMPLTVESIQNQTDDGSFSRGRSYFRGGRIHDTVLRGDTIEAQCDGSDYVPYQVRATLLPDGQKGDNPTDFSCTCPRGGFCKHIVALLLTWIENPSVFVERPSLSEAITKKSHEELAALVEQMILRYPDLESLLEMPMGVSEGAAPNVPTIEPSSIRRQIKAATGRVDLSEWGATIGVANALQPLADLGRQYNAAGQWANAEVVLTTLAEEIIKMLGGFHHDEGDLSGVLQDCDDGLAFCLEAQSDLPEDQRLSIEQRERLIASLYAIWRFDALGLGGVDLAQAGPDAIARYVTDDERTMVEEWVSKEQGSEWTKGAIVRFRIMLREHAGISDEEVLALYREAELWSDVAQMLLQMDRVGEAISVARRYIQQPWPLTTFANALLARGGEDVQRALTLVDDRLWEKEGEKPHEDARLQEWLGEQYSVHGRVKDALEMAQRGFARQPSLHSYHAVRDAARLRGQPEGTWDGLRPALLEQMYARGDWLTLAQIHLEESDVRAALDAYGKHPGRAQRAVWSSHYADGTLEHHLARAAEVEYPDEAVAIYRRMAEGHVGLRSRPNYQLAAGELSRMRATLEQHGRADEWRTFIAELRATHKTLRALQDELNKAGL